MQVRHASHAFLVLRGGAQMDTISSEQLIEVSLRQANLSLSKLFDADILSVKAPMAQPVDDIVRTEVEGIRESSKTKKNKIVVFLETTGGFAETVERIASVFRRHYDLVEFVVPNYAYSAGTLLVMSGDEIHMDYYSVLGPIDPQYQSETGDHVPGMGYLAKFQELMDKVNAAPAGAEASVRAELSLLVKKFDMARLFHIEQSIAQAKALLADWLPRYKFKDWVETETGRHPVTDDDRRRRAEQIADVLGDARRWHSHGRGISIRELASDEIKLKISNFGDDTRKNTAIRHYHGLFTDYMQRRGMRAAIHSPRALRRIM